jgi:hypothetical protein
VARDNAARESADGHAKARRDAVAASFAAREAGVRCAAASRRAVSAASIARKIASRCEGAGGDGVAAAAAAREAADRCAADAALDRAVPLADAAALEARKAAACCAAALLSPLDADEEFLHKMRGWLMTVATLFVGIAYQAVIQPPAWMTCFKPTHGRKRKFSFPCDLYRSLNLFTMATALTTLVGLLAIKTIQRPLFLRALKRMMIIIATAIAGSFIAALSRDEDVLPISLAFFAYVSMTLFVFLPIFRLALFE